MPILKALWIFYRKLIIPSLLIALALSFIGAGSKALSLWDNLGRAYFFLALLFHYLIYELRDSEEYYFYHNIGLSRARLWLVNVAFSGGIALIFIAL